MTDPIRPGKNFVEGRAPRETATAVRKLLAEEARGLKSPLHKLTCHVARPSFNGVSVTVLGVAAASRDTVHARVAEILETFLDTVPEPENEDSPQPFTFEIALAPIAPVQE